MPLVECAREPLSAHRLFRTSDVDEARQIVAAHFCDHELSPAAMFSQFDACHNRVSGKLISLNYLRYTSEISINPGELDRFYLIQIPLSGTASVSHGGRLVQSSPVAGSLLNPTRPTCMTWHSGCEQLLVQIDRNLLHRIAEAWIGQQLNEAIVFNPELMLSLPKLQRWCSQLDDSVRGAEQGIAYAGSENQNQALIEENLVLGLLLSQSSTISHLLADSRQELLTAHLKRAQSYIHENLQESLTLEQIALEAGCSIRSLQISFNRHLGCSPMRYLSQRRLKLAHYLLQSLSLDCTVSAVAYDCGFTHLGRFSIAYKQHFGQSPSCTLASDPWR